VNTRTYSSLTAFLAHRLALRNTDAREPQRSKLLAEMDALVAELSPREREAIESAGTSDEHARHRERAERHLTQILRSRGWLSG
jgi:hypothetical protein